MPDVTTAPPVTPQGAPPVPVATPPATPPDPVATPPQQTAIPGVLDAAAKPDDAVPVPAEGAKPEGDGEPQKPFELKAPEGVELDAAQLQVFSEEAQKLGLTQDQAQKLVEWNATREAASKQEVADFWAKQHQEWGEAIKTDKEIGGPEWQKKAGQARNAALAFGGQKLLTEISKLGLANHPELIRAFYRVATKMSEDSLTPRIEGAPAGPDDGLRQMYDKSPELFVGGQE